VSKNIVEDPGEIIMDKTNYITAVKVRNIAETETRKLDISKYFRVVHTQE